MATVTLDQMRDTLLPLSEVTTILSATEPLTIQELTEDSPASFHLAETWHHDLDDKADTDPVEVTMTVDGTERAMSKAGILSAAANVGLPGAYVRKTPGSLVQSHLNYWYSNLDKRYNALSVGDVVSGFTRDTLTPFSNLDLLDSVLAGIYAQYGADTEVLADYKIHNSLARTDLRLIIPEVARTITDGGMYDVPVGQSDLWSGGIHLSNSMTGKSMTSVEAYLFRWWCTNGCTTTLDEVGTWSRRSNGSDIDVYLWAQEAVEEVLGGMEDRFTEVQALTSQHVSGNVADIIRDIFTQHEVPVSQRAQITDELLESETLTMYSIMNAITRTANAPGLSPERRDRMMRIGGAVPTAVFDSIKAKVWAEGHEAEPESANPYIVGAVS